jgi:hypothetical protein
VTNPKITPARLHKALTRSAQFPSEHGFRSLLECGSCERFLTDLLLIRICDDGYMASREFPRLKKDSVDLVIHEETDCYIESKLLNLKDRGRLAPDNLVRDMSRHGSFEVFGIMYVLDERASVFDRRIRRFNDANRTTTYSIDDARERLCKTFSQVFPATTKQALLRRFPYAGCLDLYAFVVGL